ncbi:hypothetical protein GHT06_022741 [Daphnia sinensis]|uniref:ZZ-type domain-containing protein n=1 Tax=Daphnia sinensis TaxID=1820382 RepID=A0AAD5PRC6_9CRUS|nr:hypothetical protein GHT06_022741 [Daphnia sinensis]
MHKRMYSEHRELLTALNQFANIRYVAYRTAAKLKFIQSQTKLDCIKLTQIFRVIDEFGLRSSEKDLVLTMSEIRQLVFNIYLHAQKSQLVHLDYKLSSSIVLDLIGETFDRSCRRKGCTLLEFLVFFTIMCGESTLGEKYRRLLQLISDHNNCIQRRSLALMLKAIASLAHLVNEAPAFGHWTVLAAVQQCFEQCESPVGLPEDVVFGWMVREPQSIVWWSTLFRINASNKVIHPVRCSVCNIQSIQGLRYQCLQCLSYNQCQQCFWLGLISKNHKVTHQMQEYCAKTTSKEATQALWKKMSNWLTLKKNRSSSARYLPLEKGHQFRSSEISLFSDPSSMDSQATVAESTVTYQLGNQPREIASVVGHLMEEKGKLECVVQQSDYANSLGPVVKEHCDQLELQLRRLRQLVAQKDAAKENVPPQVTRVLTRLESTPLLPSQQRKNELEQLSFSPIDEPKSVIQRSSRERQSLRTSTVKANIVTNGTLNYCTPRLQRKMKDNSSSTGNNNETVVSVPRFTTEFTLRDLSRNLQQPAAPSSLAQSPTTTIDSALNAELEEILAQLDQLFPSQPLNGLPCPTAVPGGPAHLVSENATLVKATNQVAGVLAEFIDGFNE